MQERRVERTEVVETPRDAYPDDRYAGGRTERPERVGEPDLVTREADIRAADVPAGAAVDEVRATAYDPYAERRQTSSRLVQGIWLLFGIVTGLLAIRFVLKLLGANEAAGFANFIYAATGPFLAPFANLFSNPNAGGAIVELNTVVAIIVYLLAAWLLAKLIWLLAGENRAATRTVASSTRARLD